MAKNYKMTESVISVNNPSIDKILQYKEPDTFRVIEKIYNQEILNVLSKLDSSAPNYTKIDDEPLDGSTIDNLKKLKIFTGKDGHIVDYRKKVGKAKKGRYYSDNKNKKDTFSLQGLYKPVRRLILNGQCVSIDMVNSHIEIMKNICMFLNLDDNDIKILKDYCIDRVKILEDIITTYNTTRTIAKQFFLIILYGGSLNTWLSDNNLINKKDCETTFMKDFIKSFEYIKSKIKDLDVFKTFCEIEQQLSKKTKTYSIETSALAILLQEIESKISIVIKNYCEDYGCITRILIHDGLCFDDVKKVCDDEFLTKITENIEKELGLIIPLAYENTNPTEQDRIWFNKHKAFLESCDVNTDFNVIEQGYDADAAMIVVKLNKDKYIECNGELFVKEDNLWFSKDSNEYNFKKVIHNDIIKANIVFAKPDGSYKSYSKVNKNQDNCYKQILISGFKNRSNFYDEILNTCKAYLPFLDCIYSFKDNKTYSYEEKPDIYFVQRINRNFPVRNEKHMEHVKTKILNPILDDKIQLEYFLHTLCRAIAGYVEDKTWYNWVGMRNCGKSVLTMFLCNTFEGFCKTFNADQLINNKFGNPDIDRAFSWIIQHWHTRLLLSNEIKETDVDNINPKAKVDKIVLRGDMTKKMVSGGKDQIDARANHGVKHLKIRPQFTVFLCSNSTPSADPSNALDTLEAILFRSKFVDKETLNDTVQAFKLKDVSIEDDIRNYDYINAFMFIIFDHFNIKRMPTPKIVLDDTILAKGGINKCIEEFLIANFKNVPKVEWNDNNKYHTSELLHIVNYNGYGISSKVFNQKMEILHLGLYEPKHLTKDSKRSSGYYGLDINELILPSDDDI